MFQVQPAFLAIRELQGAFNKGFSYILFLFVLNFHGKVHNLKKLVSLWLNETTNLKKIAKFGSLPYSKYSNLNLF